MKKDTKGMSPEDIFDLPSTQGVEEEKKEDVEYEKLPYFKIKELIPRPGKGQETGKPVDVIFNYISTYANKSQFQNDKGEDQYQYFHKITIDGVKYTWGASPTLTKKILATGVPAGEGNHQGNIRTWSKNGRNSWNIEIPGFTPNYKATLEELISGNTSGASTSPLTTSTGWVIGHAELLARIDTLAKGLKVTMDEEFYNNKIEEYKEIIIAKQG